MTSHLANPGAPGTIEAPCPTPYRKKCFLYRGGDGKVVKEGCMSYADLVVVTGELDSYGTGTSGHSATCRLGCR